MENNLHLNERYSPMSAIIFAKMFEDNNSRGLAKNLINAVLKDVGHKEIESVVNVRSEYELIGTVNSETGKLNKGGRLDVKALDSNNHLYNIEVQIQVEPNMNERSIFYISKLITDNTGSGEKFSEIPKVIVINFLINGARENSFSYHNVAGVIYDDSGLDVEAQRLYEWASDKIEIHNIEMDVFQKTQGSKNIRSLSELGMYLRYMQSGYKNKEEGVELMKIAENLIEYSEMYNVAASDPEVQRRFDFYMSGVMDEANRMGRAKDEGLALGEAMGLKKGKLEGESIGIKKGKLEAAKNLKRDGVDNNIIAKATGISLAEIKKLK